VNVAARIAARAAGGQVLVSDAVRAALNGLAVRCRELRPLALPGREPIRLFRVQDRRDA
jgi:class 3 adenylate cyclase